MYTLYTIFYDTNLSTTYAVTPTHLTQLRMTQSSSVTSNLHNKHKSAFYRKHFVFTYMYMCMYIIFAAKKLFKTH